MDIFTIRRGIRSNKLEESAAARHTQFTRGHWTVPAHDKVSR